jgi:pyridoxine 4-dehydrogenase
MFDERSAAYATPPPCGKPARRPRRPVAFRAIAHAHNTTCAQIQLAWTLHQGPHVLAIPGTGNPDHLIENMTASAIKLSDEQLASLESPHPSSQ